jgi:hypothetical protein
MFGLAFDTPGQVGDLGRPAHDRNGDITPFVAIFAQARQRIAMNPERFGEISQIPW